MAMPELRVERRFVPAAALRVERRAEGGAPRIVGHAAVFDSWTTLYEGPRLALREVVRPGAFAAALAEGQDVRALFNHNDDYVLGRTRSGTLRLVEDGVGLAAEIDPPDTDLIRQLVLTPIERGDISGMSFAFTVRHGAGESEGRAAGERVTTRAEAGREVQERELLSLDLLDVSPVVYPAYEETEVALRALGERLEREIEARANQGKGPSPRMCMARARTATALLRDAIHEAS